MLKQLLLTTSLLFTLYSCGNQGTNSLEMVSGNIYNGSPVTDNSWDSVVALTGQYGQFCTGVLISKQIVATAAHCLEDYNKDNIKDVSIYIGNGSFAQYRGRYRVKSWELHPDYMKDVLSEYDFAYILLDKEVEEEVTILPLLSDWLETFHVYSSGSKITLVGFGQTETGISGLKHEVETTVFGNSIFKDKQINFDMYDENGKSSCYGDSGGPAFFKTSDGQIKIVGIASTVSSSRPNHTPGMTFKTSLLSIGRCQGLATYGRIDIFTDWFKTTDAGENFFN